MRILLVEDDESIREVFKLMLEADAPFEGLSVDTASCGTEAIAYLTTQEPDIVLLDLTLPEEHGFEVFQRIKRLENRSKLPVIAVTAHNLLEVEEEAAALGFAGYIKKPIDFDNELYPLLKAVIARRKSQSHAA